MWYEIASLYEKQQKKSEEKTTESLMNKSKYFTHIKIKIVQILRQN